MFIHNVSNSVSKRITRTCRQENDIWQVKRAGTPSLGRSSKKGVSVRPDRAATVNKAITLGMDAMTYNPAEWNYSAEAALWADQELYNLNTYEGSLTGVNKHGELVSSLSLEQQVDIHASMYGKQYTLQQAALVMEGYRQGFPTGIRTALIFKDMMSDAHLYTEQCRYRTDGELEAARSAEGIIHKCIKMWATRDYDNLTVRQLLTLSNGYCPDSNNNQPLMASEYWLEQRTLAEVAHRLINY